MKKGRCGGTPSIAPWKTGCEQHNNIEGSKVARVGEREGCGGEGE